ncbi:MAG TPA: hypothetical protein VFK38_01900 [Candidatus Limnocylindrales bacterium]|nr:hypothetical protein [Candidatus Limnocylindrales bacterium]
MPLPTCAPLENDCESALTAARERPAAAQHSSAGLGPVVNLPLACPTGPSSPILGTDGQLLGTFATQDGRPRPEGGSEFSFTQRRYGADEERLLATG